MPPRSLPPDRASCINRNGLQRPPLPIRSRRRPSQVVSRLGTPRLLPRRADDPTAQPFTIVIPPPNVTGALHLGHALNNTLQDILIRMKRMQGFNTLWMPGTDHAGIATQAVVERRLFEEEKKTRHDLGREGLVERIWKWKDEYEARILGQLKQLGCSCDWQRTRFTLDDTCARAVRETFFNLFKDGMIYRGKRLVNWDTFLQTAVSDDEVFHEAVEGPLLALQVPGDRPASRASRRTSRSPPRAPKRCSATRPWPCIPTRPTALDKAEAELREKLAAAPAKEKDDIQEQIDDLARPPQDGPAAARSSCATWPWRGVMLKLPLTGPRDSAHRRRMGQARTRHRLREDHAGPRSERLRSLAAAPGDRRHQHPEPRRPLNDSVPENTAASRCTPRPATPWSPTWKRPASSTETTAKTARSTSPTPTAARRRSSRTWPTSGS